MATEHSLASSEPPARSPLSPAVAEVRAAVRRCLAEIAASAPDGSLVLVALSGGPDSLALAAAVAVEAPKLGVRAGSITVDHGLQDGSAAAADRARDRAHRLGLAPAEVVSVSVGRDGGPESAARDARYAAFDDALERTGAVAILLGHTLDDQAETVLLGLARGSGAASLAGMPAARGPLRRPLLGVRREVTEAACAADGLDPWIDPHNADPAFARVRVRERVLPVLEAELGPGIAPALVRTADTLREDAEALNHMADELLEDLADHAEAGISLPVAALAANPAAVRHRLIRRAVRAEFGTSLSRTHTLEVARLVTDWRGQGPLDVPGCRVSRVGSLIVFQAATDAQ